MVPACQRRLPTKKSSSGGRYERQVMAGVGHFPQREAPRKVAEAILQFIA